MNKHKDLVATEIRLLLFFMGSDEELLTVELEWSAGVVVTEKCIQSAILFSLHLHKRVMQVEQELSNAISRREASTCGSSGIYSESLSESQCIYLYNLISD